ncbi:MAG: hypothetical protein LBF27_07690 [Sphingobacterium sp.]|jgi:hypothetical protein|nr:hypothetical protein [Sphingobacterium sp.]
MNKLIKTIFAGTILFSMFACNGAQTDDQKSRELMRDSVANDTTTIQYRDTTSNESRGEIPPTPQPDTTTKK